MSARLERGHEKGRRLRGRPLRPSNRGQRSRA
jgi:hypothetical protein